MRIDLEQFLAITVALGTVGAVATGVYITKLDGQATVAAQTTPATAQDDDLGEVEAAEPAPTVAPPELVAPAEPAATPEVIDTVLTVDDQEDLSQVPAPYSEGSWMGG